MNRTFILKRSPYKFLKFLQSCKVDQRKYLCYVKNNFKISRHQNRLAPSSPFRNVFTSTSTRRPHESPQNEESKNVLDDKDFQSILKDFASDFGVTSESEKILDDIRKSFDEPDVSSSSSSHSSVSSKKFNKPDVDVSSNSSSHSSVSSNKFKEFVDSDSVTIRSFDDQISEVANEQPFHIDDNFHTQISTESHKRGISGVFDIDDLVEALHRENLQDITVISVPEELHYTDHIVLVTAQSPRHSRAVTENILKLYKLKKHKNDPFIKPEGEKTDNWKAMDMGNIVLHIFLQETREFYDIESLWLLDPQFDTGGLLQEDPLYETIRKQMDFFEELQMQQPPATDPPEQQK